MKQNYNYNFRRRTYKKQQKDVCETTEKDSETLTENEKEGLETLEERIKRGEIVVQ